MTRSFLSPRSQSAYATSGGYLHMFGGYSRKLSQDWALATMQSVGLNRGAANTMECDDRVLVVWS